MIWIDESVAYDFMTCAICAFALGLGVARLEALGLG